MRHTGVMRWHTWRPRRSVTAGAVALLLIVVGLLAHGRPTGQPDISWLSESPPVPILLAPKPARPTHAPAKVGGVLGLGDSVPVGAGCGCPSFVRLLGSKLGQLESRPIDVVNNAQDGLTSAGLLEQVQTEHEQASASQVTLVTIGANDFDSSQLSTQGCTAPELTCFGPALIAMQYNVDAIVDALLQARGPHGPILVTGYWNVMLDGAVGASRGQDYQRDSDALTRQVNAALQDTCRRKGVTYVDVYAWFKADHDGDDTALLAPDGDHPSAAGHAVIASALLNALQTT
jgi:lysophospholipase L1-like esterase